MLADGIPDGVLADGKFGVNVGMLLEDPLEEDPEDGVMLGSEFVGIIVVGANVIAGNEDGGGVGENVIAGN